MIVLLMEQYLNLSPGILSAFIPYSNLLDIILINKSTIHNNMICPRRNKMKKFIVSIALLAVVVMALGSTSSVFAQTPTPQAPVPGTQLGFLHDEMVTVYAEALGLSVDDINTRLTNGETMAQIAYSIGKTAAEFRTMMTDVRTKAIALAVKNGTITQEQADWMNQRGNGQMMGGGVGRGRGSRGAGAGSGMGQFANPDCPYYSK
jgi:hypothetical protein